jgi:hypothetical protein
MALVTLLRFSAVSDDEPYDRERRNSVAPLAGLFSSPSPSRRIGLHDAPNGFEALLDNLRH